MQKRFKLGDKVRLTSDATQNECYECYADKVLTINHVATSTADHPGFDDGTDCALYDCEDCNLSFYDYELTRSL